MRAGARLSVLIALALVLVAGGLVGRKGRPQPASPSAGREAESLMPTAATTRALTSAWYCPGATAAPNGVANGTLLVANPTDADLTANLTLVPSAGQPVAVPFTVAARSRSIIREADFIQADHVAALIDFNGGGGVVEQQVTGPLGASLSPCASEASDHWYFPTGTTDRDRTLLLTLFNPFPGDAIVDLSFAT